MMEALSAFVLPTISVDDNGQGTNAPSGVTGEKASLECGDTDGTDEARFEDDMWAHLLVKGKIAGDERWIVGEDAEGRVTIVRF